MNMTEEHHARPNRMRGRMELDRLRSDEFVKSWSCLDSRVEVYSGWKGPG